MAVSIGPLLEAAATAIQSSDDTTTNKYQRYFLTQCLILAQEAAHK